MARGRDNGPATRFAPRGAAESLESALRVLGVTSDDDARAREQLKEVAINFNRARQFHSTAPRVRQVDKECRRVKEAAASLRSALAALSPFSQHAIHMGVLKTSGTCDLCEDELRSFARGDAVIHFEEAIREALDYVACRMGSGDPAQPDKGGSRNAWSAFYNSPRGALAEACRLLLMQYRRDAVTVYADGPLPELIAHVIDFATGGDDPDRKGLGDLAKRAVISGRLIDQAEEEERRLVPLISDSLDNEHRLSDEERCELQAHKRRRHELRSQVISPLKRGDRNALAAARAILNPSDRNSEER